MKAVITALLILLLSFNAAAEMASERFDRYLGPGWYGIYMQDNKIGYALVDLEKHGTNEWTLTVDLRMILTVQRAEMEITSTDRRFYKGAGAELDSNQMVNKSPLGDITIRGKHSGDSYEIELEIMGNRQIQTLEYPVETLDDQMVMIFKTAAGNLNAGDKFTQDIFVFDPAILGRLQHVITMTGKQSMLFSGVRTEVYSFRDSIPAMRIAGTSYCDLNGNLLLQEYPSMGMVMKLEPEELARNNAGGWDIISDNIIEVENGPKEQQNLTSGRYLLEGFDVDYLPDNPWTTVKKLSKNQAELSINQKTQDAFDLELPVNDPAFAEFLKSEPLIQSDDEKIMNLAREIKGSETNAFAAARLINNWVYANIEKRFSPVISNAIQTLAVKQGDCGEHAALTVALMRAAGIPARTAAGVGFVPSLSGFGYHAWVEVYVGEWIQMDPTWGETFADATHIMLARGDLKNLVAAVAGAMSSLNIEILESR